jgi:excisionase family DNA binding protein
MTFRAIDLLTIPELAEHLGVPVKTVRYWRAHQYGPPSARLGKRVFYRRDQVQAWVDSLFVK